MDIEKFLNNKINNQKKSTNNPLYHGVKLDIAIKLLETNEMQGSTIQRYWEDGKVRKDDDPDYETSKWMKGWSMTRSFNFALFWSGIVFEFEKEDLSKEFEIRPISWNYTIGKGYVADYKKEFEEFIIAKRTGKSSADYERIAEEFYEEYYEKYDKGEPVEEPNFNGWVDLLKRPEGKKIKDLNNKLKAIYLSDHIVNIYGKDNKNIQKLISHEKFKGIINREPLKKKVEEEKSVKANISRRERNKNKP